MRRLSSLLVLGGIWLLVAMGVPTASASSGGGFPGCTGKFPFPTALYGPLGTDAALCRGDSGDELTNLSSYVFKVWVTGAAGPFTANFYTPSSPDFTQKVIEGAIDDACKPDGYCELAPNDTIEILDQPGFEVHFEVDRKSTAKAEVAGIIAAYVAKEVRPTVHLQLNVVKCAEDSGRFFSVENVEGSIRVTLRQGPDCTHVFREVDSVREKEFSDDHDLDIALDLGDKSAESLRDGLADLLGYAVEHLH